MKKIQIELRYIVNLIDLLSENDNGESFRKKVFSIIVREQTLSLWEQHKKYSFDIPKTENGLSYMLKDCDVVNWKHLMKILMCCDYHVPSVGEKTQKIVKQISHVRRLNVLISSLGYGSIKDWRRRILLRRKRKQLLCQKVDLKSFVATAIRFYEECELGSKDSFLQEFCLSCP